MIIVYENNCQVQPDIFFVGEESKNIDKQVWTFDINSEVRNAMNLPGFIGRLHDTRELRLSQRKGIKGEDTSFESSVVREV
jgi:hypothetical protein